MTQRMMAIAAIAMACSAACGQNVRTLTRQEVADLMQGSAIVATRADNTSAAIARALKMMDEGKQFRIIEVKDIPDDWNIIQAAGGIGGGGAWQYVIDRTKAQNLPTIDDSTYRALQVVVRHTGKKISAIMRNEADGATLAAFNTAAQAGLPVVDACPTGRAKPETQMNVPAILGYRMTPAALVTRWGDEIFIEKTVDDSRYEDIGRAVAVGSGGGVSTARSLMTGAELKKATIIGELSKEIAIGKAVREAREQGKDPIAALMAVFDDAYILFKGKVTKWTPKGEGGFNYTDAEITGYGPYAGHKYRVWVKNENIESWLDGKPDVMSPDLIYGLNPKTGDTITSSYMGGYPMDTDVVFIGRKAPHPAWRSPAGIALIGPRHFGFDFDYVPIEEVMKSRPAFK